MVLHLLVPPAVGAAAGAGQAKAPGPPSRSVCVVGRASDHGLLLSTRPAGSPDRGMCYPSSCLTLHATVLVLLTNIS